MSCPTPTPTQPQTQTSAAAAALRETMARMGMEPLDDDDAPARPAPRFSDAQARALADALCAAAGHVADAELTRYLVRLFASLAHAKGELAQVLSLRGDEIAEAVEKDARDTDLHTLPDQFAALLSVAEGRAGDPAARPWLDVSAFIGAKKRTGTGAGERTDADKDYARFLNKIMGSGMMRRSQPAAAPLALMGLRERFPNFEQPIRFLAEQGAYARLRGKPFQPAPILLAGPAGCGKTSFAAALAELLGSRSEVLNMASQTCGFTLGGMDRGWSSARPGLVFEALLHGTTLAPVILLDEIDKTATDGRSDPLGPLYTLLEPRSAQAFRDEYAGIPVDASQVVWLATANDTSAIPAPLLSRFKVFEIAPPSGADLLAIAESMLVELGAGLPQAPRRLPPAWHARLAACSVRDVRIGLQEALGRAALRAVSDGAALTLDDRDLVVTAPGARAPMGFR